MNKCPKHGPWNVGISQCPACYGEILADHITRLKSDGPVPPASAQGPIRRCEKHHRDYALPQGCPECEEEFLDLKEKEFDPNGKAPSDPGSKLDGGKPLAGVLGDFALALMAVAEVGTHGAEKYSRGGWQSVPDAETRYHDAEWRHLLKRRHEDHDKDSGLLHDAHRAWNVLAQLELRLRKTNSEATKKRFEEMMFPKDVTWSDDKQWFEERDVPLIHYTVVWGDFPVTIEALRDRRKSIVDTWKPSEYWLVQIPSNRVLESLRLPMCVKKSSTWNIKVPDNVYAACENFLFTCDDLTAVKSALEDDWKDGSPGCPHTRTRFATTGDYRQCLGCGAILQTKTPLQPSAPPA